MNKLLFFYVLIFSFLSMKCGNKIVTNSVTLNYEFDNMDSVDYQLTDLTTVLFDSITLSNLRYDWQYYHSGIYPLRQKYYYKIWRGKSFFEGKHYNYITFVFGKPDKVEIVDKKVSKYIYKCFDENPSVKIEIGQIKFDFEKNKVIGLHLTI